MITKVLEGIVKDREFKNGGKVVNLTGIDDEMRVEVNRTNLNWRKKKTNLRCERSEITKD